MSKTETPKLAKKQREDHVYETAENTVAEHNPYDTKVGGKPPATLADGTVPETVKQTASKAE